jgi:2-polyprenyl-3-methyl-5-hydroxy-6-metoxy-1,4-benzoquinol methylase
MEEVHSPITLLPNVLKLKELDVEKVKQLYKASFGIDVSDFFADSLSIYKCLDSELLFYHPRTTAGDAMFYDQLSRNSWYYEDDKWEFEKVVEIVEEGSKLLEIGSGRGAFLEKLKPKTSNAVGLELSNQAAEIALQKGLNVVSNRIENFDGQDESFDYVCSFQVLEHIDNLKDVLEASVRLLRKGGKLVISVPNNSAYLKLHEYTPLNMPPHHLNLWTDESLTKIASLFNLKLIKREYEPLQDKHVHGFLAAISMGYKKNLIKKLLFILFFKSGMMKNISQIKDSIKGQTVLYVYEKI